MLPVRPCFKPARVARTLLHIKMSESNSTVVCPNQPLDLTSFIDWDGIALPDDLVEIAAKEINETPETREHGLIALQELIASLPEDKRPDGEDTSTRSLIAFLRARKYRVERAFETLCNYSDFKKENPQYFANLHGEEFRELYAQGWQRVMRGRDKGGRFVMTLVPTKMTVDTTLVKANPEILIRFSIWAQRVLVRNPYYQVLGTCIAETFENFSTWDNMKMSSALSFSLMRHTFHFSQKCMAYRLGGIYVAKQPWSMSALWFIVRPFMSTKMQQRVHLLGDEMEQLYQFVPKTVLSKDFNGDAEEDPMWFLEQGIAMEAANNQK